MDYIIGGVCTIEENNYQGYNCFEPYACDACPYNLDAELDARMEIGL
jgi:predicted xylose isomerase-like sugar epimerase